MGRVYRTSKRLNAHLMRTCMLVPERVLTLYILRKVTEEVHNRCHDAGVHIPAESCDGQWHNVVVRSIDGKPLTVFQLQKMYCERRKEQKSQKIIMCFKNVNKTTEYEVSEWKTRVYK